MPRTRAWALKPLPRYSLRPARRGCRKASSTPSACSAAIKQCWPTISHFFATSRPSSSIGFPGTTLSGAIITLVLSSTTGGLCGSAKASRGERKTEPPGYWRQPHHTRKAFDEEGFYCLGDAVRFIDAADRKKGFLFDGRISEDFKLITGTWVSVGPLRAEVIRWMSPFVNDVVVAGHDRNDVRILIFPDLYACRDLCPDFARKVPPAELLTHCEVRNKFQLLIDELAATSTGSSTRIAAGMLLHEPASLDKGEITDKGSLNQHAVLQHRNDLVEELYSAEASSRVIVARPKK